VNEALKAEVLDWIHSSGFRTTNQALKEFRGRAASGEVVRALVRLKDEGHLQRYRDGKVMYWNVPGRPNPGSAF